MAASMVRASFHFPRNINKIGKFVHQIQPRLSICQGDTAALSKTFSKTDVIMFSEISEDRNPIHLDDDFARQSRFGQPVVHGVLINGLVSAVLGMKLPGPGSILLSQQIEFPAPLFVGEEVTAEVKVEQIERRLVTFAVSCVSTKRDQVVMKGSVKLLVPKSAIQR